MVRYSDEELLDEICRLADELGHPPTLQEARDRAKFGVMTYFDRFGSWRNTIEKAGYEPREPETEISDEKLLKELDRLAEDLGERPSVAQMNEHGKYWASTYRNHFDSWTGALDAAGFDTSDIPDRSGSGGETGPPVETHQLLEDLQQLGEALGRRPTWDDMADHGGHSPSTYVRRFDSWSNALEAAGFEPPTSEIGRDALKSELQRLAEELGRRPTKRDMISQGKYSASPYENQFGSWSDAVSTCLTGKFEQID